MTYATLTANGVTSRKIVIYEKTKTTDEILICDFSSDGYVIRGYVIDATLMTNDVILNASVICENEKASDENVTCVIRILN